MNLIHVIIIFTFVIVNTIIMSNVITTITAVVSNVIALICVQYLLRDILQFDNTLNDSINRITNAHRTCDLILGVGDGKVVYFEC
jgi:hypothetical protein